MAEPEDMIMPMLREMREEIKRGRTETKRTLEEIRSDIAKLQDGYRSQHSAMVADTLMSKLITGDFEQRIEALEAEVASLKADQH